MIETNFSTIKNLEAVLKKMNRMPQEEAAKYRLDNTLGGTSESINRNSIHRFVQFFCLSLLFSVHTVVVNANHHTILG